MIQLITHLDNGTHQPVCKQSGKLFYKLTKDQMKSTCPYCGRFLTDETVKFWFAKPLGGASSGNCT